ncbi:MAG: hypothetical protein ACLFUB_01365 [Cyclobacteriaceae bacterium]
MYRIINSLAIAQFHKKINAVEIHFKGDGIPWLYYETLDLSLNIASVHATKAWLLRKSSFLDVSPSQLLEVLQSWAEDNAPLLNQFRDECFRFALLTNESAYLKFTQEIDYLQDGGLKLGHLHFQLFTNPKDAAYFLNSGYRPRVLA